MNALFELFNDAERRTLARTGLAALVVLVVFLAVFARVRGGLAGDRKASVRLQEAAQKAVKSRDEARVRWKLWEDAGRDLADLRGDAAKFQRNLVFLALLIDANQYPQRRR